MLTEKRIPEVGQAVRVRNRLATVRAVDPYESRNEGRLHLVEVEYLDDCRFPEADQLLWEVEATARVLGSTSLPGVDANRPDSPAALQAFLNAHRWTRLNRLRASPGLEAEPLTVAAGGAAEAKVTVERHWPDFQGKVQLTGLNLPPGFGVATTDVPPDRKEATVKLTVAGNVPPGSYSVVLRGDAQVPFSRDGKTNKTNVRVADPATPLTVVVTPPTKK